MLIILTSAKTMTGTSKIKAPAGTMPRFAQEANEIALNMAQFSTDDLKKILKLNPKLALENYNRFQEFHTAEVHSLQALLAYTGVVFKNINPKDFTEDDFLCSVADAVHGSDPCHLVSLFHTLCYVLSGFHLLNDKFKAILCLLIQILQIRPQFTAKAQIIEADRVMLLDIISVHTSPPTDRSVFLR